MKKLVALAAAAAGLVWAIGQKRKSTPQNTWADGTDRV